MGRRLLAVNTGSLTWYSVFLRAESPFFGGGSFLLGKSEADCHGFVGDETECCDRYVGTE